MRERERESRKEGWKPGTKTGDLGEIETTWYRDEYQRQREKMRERGNEDKRCRDDYQSKGKR